MTNPAPIARSDWTRWLPALACLALWLGVEVLRTRGNPGTTKAPSPAWIGTQSRSPDDPGGSSRSGTHRPASPAIREYNHAVIAQIFTASDPASAAVLAAITNSMPPGWEEGFVLHDCLVAMSILADVSRLDPGSSATAAKRGDAATNSPDPAGREERTYHGFLEEFLCRWLVRKHPALGEQTIRSLLARPSLSLNPALGSYDLIPVEDSLRWFGIPLPDPEPAHGMEVPVELHHRYREGKRRRRRNGAGTPRNRAPRENSLKPGINARTRRRDRVPERLPKGMFEIAG